MNTDVFVDKTNHIIDAINNELDQMDIKYEKIAFLYYILEVLKILVQEYCFNISDLKKNGMDNG